MYDGLDISQYMKVEARRQIIAEICLLFIPSALFEDINKTLNLFTRHT